MLTENSVKKLCNFDEKLNDTDDPIITQLWTGKWDINDNEFLKELLETKLEKGGLEDMLRTQLEGNGSLDKALCTAITVLVTFCDQNWTPHPEPLDLAQYLGTVWPADLDAATLLQQNSETIFVNILHPELLYLSIQVFSVLYSLQQNLLHLWWCHRSKVIHQRILENTSETLYNELELMTAKLSNEAQMLQVKPRLQILLFIEIAQAYLIYGRVQKVEEYLLRAKELAGLKLELIGILGKRTKFQQKSLPQLALSSELDASIERPPAELSHGSTELPEVIELSDDVRLDKIEYAEKISQAELPSLEQIICLLTVQYMQKAQPKDELLHEELQPYVEAVLAQRRGAWGARVAALLTRCALEAAHRRTVERAMLQCEAIVNDKAPVANTDRLSYLWASGLPPAWTWRRQLADLYLSLGLVKAALEEYQRLQLWEEVIVCYTMLQLRHKAAEVIRQQIEIKPTIKLYCLLGDATDDVSWYEKAWQVSGSASSRAQRHWGHFLFERKRYAECVPHYEASLQINSIQETVWLRLGYAALATEQWEVSAGAYRRYTYLQPNSFEAWNNLAKAYVAQGDRRRAHRALTEALRYNYDNWKLWENVVAVSADTGHWEDVARGCGRLLELRGRCDAGPLARLAAAVARGRPGADGADGAASGRLRSRVLDLFERVTSVDQNNPDIWLFYADVSPTYLLKAQRLLKAYKAFTQNGNWPNNHVTCKKVIDICQLLLEYSLKARQEAEDKDKLPADQIISSARLTGQAVIRAVEKQNWEETRPDLDTLKQLFTNVTEYMKSIM